MCECKDTSYRVRVIVVYMDTLFFKVFISESDVFTSARPAPQPCVTVLVVQGIQQWMLSWFEVSLCFFLSLLQWHYQRSDWRRCGILCCAAEQNHCAPDRHWPIPTQIPNARCKCTVLIKVSDAPHTAKWCWFRWKLSCKQLLCWNQLMKNTRSTCRRACIDLTAFSIPFH